MLEFGPQKRCLSLITHGYYNGASLVQDCAEVNMTYKIDLMLKNPQDRGNDVFYSATVDLSEQDYGPLTPDQGDDTEKEFAFFDNSPSPDTARTQTLPSTGIDLNGADCYFMAEHLKTLAWLNRGVSHPTDPALACDDDDKDNPAEVRPWAKGGRVWGRPINAGEFVAAAGAEKIVASAGFSHMRKQEKLVTTQHGSEWLFPGKTKSRDHILVKSTADLVYLGGHTGGGGTGSWSGENNIYLSPRKTDASESCVVPSGPENGPMHWKLYEGKQEVEWLVLIACWGLQDGTAAQNWANEMGRVHLRGILGFHGYGWSGRREGLAFLHFADSTSKATLKEITIDGGKSVIELEKEAARVLPENTSVEGSGDYSADQRATFKTFAPGDSITVGGQSAMIEDIDVTQDTEKKGKVFLATDIGEHENGEQVVSLNPCMKRGWLVAWGGVARENTVGYHSEGKPVPCASLVHPDAVGDRLAGTWKDGDFADYSELRYEAVEHIANVWSMISKILSGE